MRNQKRDFKIWALGRENAKNSFSIHATPNWRFKVVTSLDLTQIRQLMENQYTGVRNGGW